MSSRSFIPGAMLLTVALAGCGGSSGPSLSAFKTGFAADKVQFRQLGADLGAALQSAAKKTDAEIAAEFGALSARGTQQAAQLRKLNPPAKFKSDLDQLAASFDTVATDLHTIAGDATASNAAAAKAASETLVVHSATVKTIDRSLTAKLGLPQTG